MINELPRSCDLAEQTFLPGGFFISNEVRKRLCLFRTKWEKRNTWTYFERSEKKGILGLISNEV